MVDRKGAHKRVPGAGGVHALNRDRQHVFGAACTHEKGASLPADIEFGFAGGRLALLQIRPFVESSAAQQNLYLLELDAGLKERGAAKISLDGVPTP